MALHWTPVLQVVNASMEVDWPFMRLLLKTQTVEKLLRLSGCGNQLNHRSDRYDMTPRGRVDFNDVSLIPDTGYRIISDQFTGSVILVTK
jgi:hypothetical protein